MVFASGGASLAGFSDFHMSVDQRLSEETVPASRRELQPTCNRIGGR